MNAPEDQKKRRDLRPPSLPRVTRLSRNVLLVAGLAAAAIVLVVSRFVGGSEPAEDGTQRANSSRVEAGIASSLDARSLTSRRPIAIPTGVRMGWPGDLRSI